MHLTKVSSDTSKISSNAPVLKGRETRARDATEAKVMLAFFAFAACAVAGAGIYSIVGSHALNHTVAGYCYIPVALAIAGLAVYHKKTNLDPLENMARMEEHIDNLKNFDTNTGDYVVVALAIETGPYSDDEKNMLQAQLRSKGS